ncbi:MAG: acyloxyacyl hydrolase [Desulfatitalea sp.]|nr:acyloxyacyl hydrolase [Desulfatitalea sp.]
MKRVRSSFIRLFIFTFSAIFCLLGCAVIPNDPAHRPPLISTDSKTDRSPAIGGRNPDSFVVPSPAGQLLDDGSMTPMRNENDSDGRADFIDADDDRVPFIKRLISVSVRATFSGTDIIGDEAPESFREYGVSANFGLPWTWYSPAGWGVGTRLMASAGALHATGETGLVVSLIPIVAFGRQDGKLSLDMGAGGAALSRDHFGTQDLGGWFQFALTAGAGVFLSEQLGVGYRFLHYSDAGIHGPHSTGADMHMLELLFRF